MIPRDCGTETRDSHRLVSKAQRGTTRILAIACKGILGSFYTVTGSIVSHPSSVSNVSRYTMYQ